MHPIVIEAGVISNALATCVNRSLPWLDFLPVWMTPFITGSDFSFSPLRFMTTNTALVDPKGQGTGCASSRRCRLIIRWI